jgi:hypothetical protein
MAQHLGPIACLMTMDYGHSICLAVVVCVCVGGDLEHCVVLWVVPMWLRRWWAWMKGDETLKGEAIRSGLEITWL